MVAGKNNRKKEVVPEKKTIKIFLPNCKEFQRVYLDHLDGRCPLPIRDDIDRAALAYLKGHGPFPGHDAISYWYLRSFEEGRTGEEEVRLIEEMFEKTSLTMTDESRKFFSDGAMRKYDGSRQEEVEEGKARKAYLEELISKQPDNWLNGMKLILHLHAWYLARKEEGWWRRPKRTSKAASRRAYLKEQNKKMKQQAWRKRRKKVTVE